MHFQSLEQRRLYTVSWSPRTHILYWDGRGADDKFYLYQDASRIFTEDNGNILQFSAKDVAYFVGHGRSGNDRIWVAQSITFPCRIFGQDGNDLIYSGAGSDILDGGAGNDTINGSEGTDRIDYSRSASAMTFNLIASKGKLSGTASNGIETDSLDGIDLINGTPFADTYALDGSSPATSGYIAGDLYGPGQDKKIAAIAKNYHIPAIQAGGGNDAFNITGVVSARLFGGADDDTFTAAVDPNAARPFAWVDYIDGGEGNDTQVIAGKYGFIPGKTITNVGGIFNRMYPNIEIARLNNADFGGGFWGNDLNNQIYVTSAHMAIHGGLGEDLIHVEGDQTEQITVYGDDGNDLIEASTATSSTGVLTSIIYGGSGNDRISGTNGADSIYGELGDDVINGFAGDDLLYDYSTGTLYGDDGNDWLAGYDISAHGGAGNDIIRSSGATRGSDLEYFGDDGDDTFYVRDGRRSRVDGGLGIDKAKRDSKYDTLKNVESTF